MADFTFTIRATDEASARITALSTRIKGLELELKSLESTSARVGKDLLQLPPGAGSQVEAQMRAFRETVTSNIRAARSELISFYAALDAGAVSTSAITAGANAFKSIRNDITLATTETRRFADEQRQLARALAEAASKAGATNVLQYAYQQTGIQALVEQQRGAGGRFVAGIGVGPMADAVRAAAAELASAQAVGRLRLANEQELTRISLLRQRQEATAAMEIAKIRAQTAAAGTLGQALGVSLAGGGPLAEQLRTEQLISGIKIGNEKELARLASDRQRREAAAAMEAARIRAQAATALTFGQAMGVAPSGGAQLAEQLRAEQLLASIRVANEEQVTRVATARQRQEAAAAMQAARTRVLGEATNLAGVIDQTTGVGRAAAFTREQIAEMARAWPAVGAGAHAAFNTMEEGSTRFGQSFRHVIALFDEFFRGQRGAMVASTTALARDSGVIESIISRLTLSWGLFAAAGVAAAAAVGYAIEQSFQRFRSIRETVSTEAIQGFGLGPQQQAGAEASFDRSKAATNEYAGSTKNLKEELDKLPPAAHAIKESFDEAAKGYAGLEHIEPEKAIAPFVKASEEGAVALAEFITKFRGLQGVVDSSGRSLVEIAKSAQTDEEAFRQLAPYLIDPKLRELGTAGRKAGNDLLVLGVAAGFAAQYTGEASALMDQFAATADKAINPTKGATQEISRLSEAVKAQGQAVELGNSALDKRIKLLSEWASAQDAVSRLGRDSSATQEQRERARSAAETLGAEVRKTPQDPAEELRHRIALENIRAEAQARKADVDARLEAARAVAAETQRSETQRLVGAGMDPETAARMAAESEAVIAANHAVEESQREVWDERRNLTLIGIQGEIAAEGRGAKEKVELQKQYIAVLAEGVAAQRRTQSELAEARRTLSRYEYQANREDYLEAAKNYQNQLREAKGSYDAVTTVIGEWRANAAQHFDRSSEDFKRAMEDIERSAILAYRSVVQEAISASSQLEAANRDILATFEHLQSAKLKGMGEAGIAAAPGAIQEEIDKAYELQKINKQSLDLDMIMADAIGNAAQRTEIWEKEWRLGVNTQREVAQLQDRMAEAQKRLTEETKNTQIAQLKLAEAIARARGDEEEIVKLRIQEQQIIQADIYATPAEKIRSQAEVINALADEQKRAFSAAEQFEASQERLDRLRIQANRLQLQTQVNEHSISKTTMEAREAQFTSQIMAQEEARVEAMLANNDLTSSQKEKLYEHLAELYEKDAELQIAAQEKVSAAIEKENEKRTKLLKDTFDKVGDSIEKSITGILTGERGTQNIQQLRKGIISSVVSEVGGMASQFAGKKLADLAGVKTEGLTDTSLGSILSRIVGGWLGLTKDTPQDAMKGAAEKIAKAAASQEQAMKLLEPAAKELKEAGQALKDAADALKGGKGAGPAGTVPAGKTPAEQYGPPDTAGESAKGEYGGGLTRGGGVGAKVGAGAGAEPGGVPAEYAGMIEKFASKYAVPKPILTALIGAESSFNPNLVSSAGARGLGQFMPGTAAQYGVDVTDAASSIEGTAKYLSKLYKDTGSWTEALGKYSGQGPSLSEFAGQKNPWGPRLVSAARDIDTGGTGEAASRAASTVGPSASEIRDISAEANLKSHGQMEEIKGMIIHHTAGGQNVQDVLNTFRQRGLSSNFVIDREGNIFQVQPTGTAGAHIRPGWGEKGEGLTSRNMEGVEIIAKNDADVLKVQQEAALRLVQLRSQALGYDPRTSVFGHGEVNPGWKDPSEGLTVANLVRGGALDKMRPQADADAAKKTQELADAAQQAAKKLEQIQPPKAAGPSPTATPGSGGGASMEPAPGSGDTTVGEDIPPYALGGPVGTDTVLGRLTPGERILTVAQRKIYDRMFPSGIERYQGGGLVGFSGEYEGEEGAGKGQDSPLWQRWGDWSSRGFPGPRRGKWLGPMDFGEGQIIPHKWIEPFADPGMDIPVPAWGKLDSPIPWLGQSVIAGQEFQAGGLVASHPGLTSITTESRGFAPYHLVQSFPGLGKGWALIAGLLGLVGLAAGAAALFGDDKKKEKELAQKLLSAKDTTTETDVSQKTTPLTEDQLPKMHGGGLAQDEMVAVLQRGERVIPRFQAGGLVPGLDAQSAQQSSPEASPTYSPAVRGSDSGTKSVKELTSGFTNLTQATIDVVGQMSKISQGFASLGTSSRTTQTEASKLQTAFGAVSSAISSFKTLLGSLGSSASAGGSGGGGGILGTIGSVFGVAKGIFGLFLEEGGIVPSAQGGMILGGGLGKGGTLAILHPNEMVLPSNISRSVQDMAAGGGNGMNAPDIHFHLHTIDQRSGAQFLMSHKDVIAGLYRNAYRNFNPNVPF